MTSLYCWKCGDPVLEGDLCRACGELQPFPEGLDHFAVFGLSRRLGLDPKGLEASFHALSRRFHPDFYQTQGPETRAISLENSARLNVAYRTLRNPLSRVEYLLELEGLPAGTPSNPPGELFEEILELQEARQEYRATKSLELQNRLKEALGDLEDRKTALEDELFGLFEAWDGFLSEDGERTERQRKPLERMRGILATRAFLRTVSRDLGEELKGS